MASVQSGRFVALAPAPFVNERRRNARRSAARLVQVEHGGEADFGHCRDISDTGMRLETKRPIDFDDTVTIAFSQSRSLRGRVIWVRGAEYGIAFTRPIDSALLLRAMMPNLPALSNHRDRAHSLDIPDLAVLGNQSGQSHEFRPGLTVTVMAPSGDEERAVVQWAQEKMVGLLLLEHKPRAD